MLNLNILQHLFTKSSFINYYELIILNLEDILIIIKSALQALSNIIISQLLTIINLNNLIT